MEWRCKKQINSISEQVLLSYFAYLSSKYKSSTLWTYYSMLRSTLSLHHNIKIEQYHKLRSFLKRTSENYQPKKAKTLTPEEINKFITEAPDEVYLVTKVAVVMGIMGACRATELYAMQIEDVQDFNTTFFVKVPNPNSKVVRRFTITDNFYNICKKYISLRVPNVNTFFLNYHNGKCSIQRMGINKFGQMGKEVAKYLKLPNPGLYTGHCFRRSSANLLVDGGGDITDLQHLGGWRKPSDVAEILINDSLNKMQKIAPRVVQETKSHAEEFGEDLKRLQTIKPKPVEQTNSSTEDLINETLNNLQSIASKPIGSMCLENGFNTVPNYGLRENSDLVPHNHEVSRSTTPISSDPFEDIRIKQSISDEDSSSLDNGDLEIDTSMPVEPMYVAVDKSNRVENNCGRFRTNEVDVANDQNEVVYQQLRIMDEESIKKMELMEKEMDAKIKFMEREHEANMDCIQLRKEILQKEIELLNIKINKEKS